MQTAKSNILITLNFTLSLCLFSFSSCWSRSHSFVLVLAIFWSR